MWVELRNGVGGGASFRQCAVAPVTASTDTGSVGSNRRGDAEDAEDAESVPTSRHEEAQRRGTGLSQRRKVKPDRISG